MVRFILILYIWSGTEQHCVGMNQCGPIKGTATVTSVEFFSIDACNDAGNAVQRWTIPKNHRSQGPDVIMWECVKK